MKVLSQTTALNQLKLMKDELRREIETGYEHRAKDCGTCATRGACCVDAHFVNVHISRLEAIAINDHLAGLTESKRSEIEHRVRQAIVRYGLNSESDTSTQTYACPLFEPTIGCIVHEVGKPAACIVHACYENKADLPPDDLQMDREAMIDRLNTRVFGSPQQWLPIPLAILRR
jgi:hypothetical protein